MKLRGLMILMITKTIGIMSMTMTLWTISTLVTKSSKTAKAVKQTCMKAGTRVMGRGTGIHTKFFPSGSTVLANVTLAIVQNCVCHVLGFLA